MKNSEYVLITPARNEEAYIEKTIQSVISQTVIPKKWVIVSDGSTDRTDEIIKRYEASYNWIESIRMPAHRDYNLYYKTICFNSGVKRVKDIHYDFIGILDADISFDQDYFENLFIKFQRNPKLGVGGGYVVEYSNGKSHKLLRSLSGVAGAVQLFRRECYEQIGGYQKLPHGRVDGLAVIMARMHGWETLMFRDLKVYHLKPMGGGYGNFLLTRCEQGKADYSVGYHPLFEILLCIRRTIERPYLIGSLVRMFCYLWLWVRGVKKLVPDDVVRYLRHEQLQRLFGFLLKKNNKEA